MAPPFKDYSGAVKMFNHGIPIAEIARRYGVTRQSMHKILERRGCFPKKKKRKKDEK